MEPIRVLQIVDSLNIGGAESVALNLANDLNDEPGYQSFLVCTREEGPLNERIRPGVGYLFLSKKRQLDVAAILKLHRFIRQHKIDIVHAHSTSFYYPALLKILHRYKLVWHDHYGMEIKPDGKRWYPYIPFSRAFNFAISVNENLLASNKMHLHVKANKQDYLPNYSVSLATGNTEKLDLTGNDAYRIVCLANLRPQKDHQNLLHAFKVVKSQLPQATLYCLGICSGDEYEKEIRKLIISLELTDSVVLTGGVSNPFLYLERSAVAVLSSLSEGLPLSLIEYGLAGLPVVCTNVGQCADLLKGGENGILVPASNAAELGKAIIKLFTIAGLKEKLAASFNSFIRNHYSKQAILQKLKIIYQSVIKK
jgi:glycosyltransferase involved in cell wall biosynthesis